MTTRTRGLVVLFVLLEWTVGCSSETGVGDDLDDAEMGLEKACPRDTPAFDFGPTGLTSEPNTELGLQVYLDEASAMPPLNGSNDWTIQITDLDGNPMPEANLVWACAFMPAHKHGSNPKSVRKLGDGKFELVRQNMAMEGGWDIRLWIDPSGGGTTYEGGATEIGDMACVGPAPDWTVELKACVPG